MFILVCVPVHRGYRFPTAPHIFLRSRFKIIVGVSVFIRTGVSDLRFKKAATSAVFLGVHVLLATDKEGGPQKQQGPQQLQPSSPITNQHPPRPHPPRIDLCRSPGVAGEGQGAAAPVL